MLGFEKKWMTGDEDNVRGTGSLQLIEGDGGKRAQGRERKGSEK